jgi:hypothetical protein
MPGITPVFNLVCLNRFVLRYAYTHTHNAKHKFEAAAADGFDTFKAVMDAEVELWKINDLKTHMFTTNEFLHVDNCKQQVNVPVCHVASKGDYYFNNQVVEQHMRIIFSEYIGAELDLRTHAPSVVATKKESAAFIAPKVRKLLNKMGK